MRLSVDVSDNCQEGDLAVLQRKLVQYNNKECKCPESYSPHLLSNQVIIVRTSSGVLRYAFFNQVHKILVFLNISFLLHNPSVSFLTSVQICSSSLEILPQAGMSLKEPLPIQRMWIQRMRLLHVANSARLRVMLEELHVQDQLFSS